MNSHQQSILQISTGAIWSAMVISGAFAGGVVVSGVTIGAAGVGGVLVGGVVGGVVVLELTARSRTVRALWRRLMTANGRQRRRDLHRDRAPRLRSFRAAIVGADKQTIAAALGPPPATIGRGIFVDDAIWYYPLDQTERLALAIAFDDRDVAQGTEVVRTPEIRNEQSASER